MDNRKISLIGNTILAKPPYAIFIKIFFGMLSTQKILPI